MRAKLDLSLDSEFEDFESFEKFRKTPKNVNPQNLRKSDYQIRAARRMKEKARQAALEEITAEEE